MPLSLDAKRAGLALASLALFGVHGVLSALLDIIRGRISVPHGPVGTVTHSGLMLAARMTLAHLSVSCAMSVPKSVGEPAMAVPPSSANRALIFGSASPALISRLSLLMTARGVFFGAPRPNHPLIS